MLPANAATSIATNGMCWKIETTKTISVEKNAEPAASPSSPSIRLNALVIAMTHATVSGSESNGLSVLFPKIASRWLIFRPEA